MKKILYMHGGSGNHGCEAIVRTTAELLGGPRGVVLWSQNKAEDVRYGSASCVETVVESEQIRKYSPSYFEAQFRRRILREPAANMDVFLRDQFRNALAISIGGDNYCYPWSAKFGAETDRKIRRSCAASVLWACSIDRESITPEVREDLERFDRITAREQLTYELLRTINPNTVKVADPAFLLAREELPLPETFAEGNTVGINVSPMAAGYASDQNVVLENFRALIRFLLTQTTLHVCLIPHVIWSANDDRVPLRALYEEFSGSGRISYIPDGTCMQLKGFIARCRFFVGARTHATIAAYSSLVPTLAVGYSLKARGIALDLFDTDEGYVIPVQSMEDSGDLTERFRWLMEHEQEQKDRLRARIPQYQDAANAKLDLET